jgi:high-affinity nickel-transport protein
VIKLGFLLTGMSLGAWAFAFAVFHNKPILLGTVLLDYTFDLRHAVDVDHIAAIEN